MNSYNVNDVFENINNQLSIIDSRILNHDQLDSNLTSHKTNMLMANTEIEIREQVSSILIQSSKVMRDKAKIHFENIITDALQFISQDTSYKFIVEEGTQRGKPSYEFYIETVINGEVSRQKPEDSCGGGFIDIISVTAKTAYLEIFDNPKIMNSSFILDEAGKMISEQMSIKFAEYIKFLGNEFNKQMIMITHNDSLSAIADKTFLVQKNNKGVSEVQVVNDINTIGEIIDSVSEDMKEKNDE